jgi:hypothetical protein
MTYNSTVLADSPKHYITFDQTSGGYTDSGTQGATTTVTGSPVQVNGISGKALTYNGTSDYVTINSPYDFAANSTFTFECWFKSTATTGQPTFIRRDGNGAAYLLRLNAGKIEFYCNQAGIVTTASYADGNWHHVVGVKNGTATTLYVDGTQVGTGTGGTVAQATGAQPIYLGESTSAASEMMKGTLDEVAIYNVALTSTQVTNHHNAGANVTTTPPVFNMGPITVPVPVTLVLPPAMTLSLASPNATVTGDNTSTYSITNDVDTSGQSASAATIRAGLNTAAFRTDAFSTPAGFSPASAKLWIYCTTATSGTFNVYEYPNSWNESDHATWGSGTLALGSTLVGTFSPVAGWNSIDVSSTVAKWLAGTATNNGFELYGAGTFSANSIFSSHDAATNKPYLAVTYAVASPVTITGPPMTLSLNAVAPGVSETSNLTLTAPAMTTALTFPGGIPLNPDCLETPPAISLTLTTPDATPVIAYPTLLAVPAINAGSLELESNVSVNLTTNRLAAVPPMNLTLKWVGTYIETADRYLTITQSHIATGDIWLKLDDSEGAIKAHDSESGHDIAFSGGLAAPVSDGPYLRKASHFNGTSAYLGPFDEHSAYSILLDGLGNSTGEQYQYNMPLTVEFSIRTTQLNGIVYSGYMSHGFQANQAWGPSGNEVLLKDGFITLKSSDGTTIKARKFVADGQWHHIVIAIPDGNTVVTGNDNGTGDIFQSNLNPSYVAIDGQPVIVRRGGFFSGSTQDYGHLWTPWTFMARPATTVPANWPVPASTFSTSTGFINGDLSSVIVRPNNYLSLTLAQSIYYEWSNSVIAEPEAMVVSLDFTPPFKAKGNVKKMLAVYGLPNGYAANGLPRWTYQSVLSGFIVKHRDGISETWPHVALADSSAAHNPYFYTPETFRAGEYMVYPVSIVGDGFHNHSGPSSMDGLISEDAATFDSNYDNYVDDSTGLPRFINLQEDLSVDITEFDVVTVVNYPFPNTDAGTRPDWVFSYGPTEVSQEGFLYQHDMGLTPGQWEDTRDALRDSLLDAAYEGVSLWVGEWHMAQHLGFIQGVDFISAGYWDTWPRTDNVNNVLDFAQFNQAAQDLDAAHIDPASRYASWRFSGGYQSWPQVNMFRKVVSLEPGLTDLPSTEYKALVEGFSIDRLKPNGDFQAWELLRATNGLRVGDQMLMPIMWEYDPHGGNQGPEFRRKHVISARPDGVVGRVVTRPMDTFHGPGGIVIENPIKDNALTIIAERGTVVRGKPISGRVFIELMDIGVDDQFVAEDAVKGPMSASAGGGVTTWDFDDRRYTEIKGQLNSTKLHFNSNTGVFDTVTITTDILYFGWNTYTLNRRKTWHGRGLNWLSETPTIEAGDAVSFAQPMIVSLKTPNAGVQAEKHPVIAVTGAMRLTTLEVRQPANYRDGSIEEYATAMELALEMRGIGSNVAVPAMSLSLATGQAPVVKAATETVIVYLDSDTTTKLYLKEDN